MHLKLSFPIEAHLRCRGSVFELCPCSTGRIGRTPGEIISHVPTITLADVHAALAYYFDHIDEIQAEMRAEESRRNSPSLLEAKLRQERLEEAS